MRKKVAKKNVQAGVSPGIIARRNGEQPGLNSASRAPNKRLLSPVAANNDNACLQPPATLRANPQESDILLRIIERASQITSHYDLFRLVQGDVQQLLSHQILISAWGDFHSPNITIDVVSALPGVRTRQVQGCGITRLLNDQFALWFSEGKKPLILQNAACEPLALSTCDNCALHAAMKSTRSVLVHGVRGERDGIDSLYLAFSRDSWTDDYSAEQVSLIADSLIPQIDIAFRKVAALKSEGDHVVPSIGNLSAREQEIMKWIAEGRTNIDVAAILRISSFTVKNHVQRIFRKLNATNRTEAVARYRYAALQAHDGPPHLNTNSLSS